MHLFQFTMAGHNALSENFSISIFAFLSYGYVALLYYGYACMWVCMCICCHTIFTDSKWFPLRCEKIAKSWNLLYVLHLSGAILLYILNDVHSSKAHFHMGRDRACVCSSNANRTERQADESVAKCISQTIYFLCVVHTMFPKIWLQIFFDIP